MVVRHNVQLQNVEIEQRWALAIFSRYFAKMKEWYSAKPPHIAVCTSFWHPQKILSRAIANKGGNTIAGKSPFLKAHKVYSASRKIKARALSFIEYDQGDMLGGPSFVIVWLSTIPVF